MTFEERMKSVVWTGAEVGVGVLGAVASGQFLADEKIFAKDFKENPAWFGKNREGAKFYIYWSGGLKAGAALLASTYVKNPWVKLFLYGVAFQGGVQQLRILTWDKDKDKARFRKIGDADASSLDAQLKAAANQYRSVNGPVYVNGPRYINGADDEPLARRYASSVAGLEDMPLATRYSSSVSGSGMEQEDRIFDLSGDDGTGVF